MKLESKRKEKCNDNEKFGKITQNDFKAKGFYEPYIRNDQQVKKRKISSPISSSQSDNTLKNIKQVEEKNYVEEVSRRTSSGNELNIKADVQEAEIDHDILEDGEDRENGEVPCLENDNISSPLQPRLDEELKNSKIIQTIPNSEKLFPKVYCPICNMTDGMNLNLKQHMKAKREVKCQNCSLYFSNCNTLRVHLDGRCKKMKSKTT